MRASEYLIDHLVVLKFVFSLIDIRTSSRLIALMNVAISAASSAWQATLFQLVHYYELQYHNLLFDSAYKNCSMFNDILNFA